MSNAKEYRKRHFFYAWLLVRIILSAQGAEYFEKRKPRTTGAFLSLYETHYITLVTNQNIPLAEYRT